MFIWGWDKEKLFTSTLGNKPYNSEFDSFIEWLDITHGKELSNKLKFTTITCIRDACYCSLFSLNSPTSRIQNVIKLLSLYDKVRDFRSKMSKEASDRYDRLERERLQFLNNKTETIRKWKENNPDWFQQISNKLPPLPTITTSDRDIIQDLFMAAIKHEPIRDSFRNIFREFEYLYLITYSHLNDGSFQVSSILTIDQSYTPAGGNVKHDVSGKFVVHWASYCEWNYI